MPCISEFAYVSLLNRILWYLAYRTSVEPYDETLSEAMTAWKRKRAEEVAEKLDEKGLLSDDVTLVFHAGKDYYEELLPLIEDSGVSVEIPTEGLQIGKKAWYKERI